MKRIYLLCLMSLFLEGYLPLKAQLNPPPDSVSRIKEVVVVYNEGFVNYFNDLTPQERIFIYYMFRASLAGNIIARDQYHRHAPTIIAILEYVFNQQDILLQKKLSFDTPLFLADVETYLTYLWTNHSQYFARETSEEKRSPERLNLSLLTKENLLCALEVLGYPNAYQTVEDIDKSLFDGAYEPTLTIPDNIEKSAVNFYALDFTDEDFSHLSTQDQSVLNAYCYVNTQNGQRTSVCQRYSVDGKYAEELSVIVYWLEKAYELTKQHPHQFDKHFVKSLEYLIDHFKTGDEELFKKHSVEWLKSHSRLDYVFGFIETYNDPKSYRAIFQSDITIKSLDINALSNILPDIEQRLPIHQEFMRQAIEGKKGLLNASINVKAFSAGSLGPLNTTLAYCLPNYNEIKSQEGSKQIIYHPEKTLGELVNPEISRRLFNGTQHYEWFKQHDPMHQLMNDILTLEVILHETLGHGSGQLTTHTFQEGESLTVEGKTYRVGDTVAVTSANLPQFLTGYDNTIEELRAEIIALLASIECHDEFVKIGMLKDWPNKISKETIIDFSIISMARTGLRRLCQQAETATHITGDHARANTTIMYYLIDNGGIELRVEPVTINDKEYKTLDAYIIDRDKAIKAVKQLANLVQEIKSTGNGLKAQWLIEKYGTNINQDYMRIMQENMKTATSGIKVSAMLYPIYIPQKNSDGTIVDINTVWPDNLTQAYQLYHQLALSTQEVVDNPTIVQRLKEKIAEFELQREQQT